MRRTNTFEVVPQSEQADTVLRRLLDASASLWNQLTYARRQQFFASESVWDCQLPTPWGLACQWASRVSRSRLESPTSLTV